MCLGRLNINVGEILIKIFQVITYYIDKVSSPLLDDSSKARDFCFVCFVELIYSLLTYRNLVAALAMA